jgi:hypothetical protein
MTRPAPASLLVTLVATVACGDAGGGGTGTGPGATEPPGTTSTSGQPTTGGSTGAETSSGESTLPMVTMGTSTGAPTTGTSAGEATAVTATSTGETGTGETTEGSSSSTGEPPPKCEATPPTAPPGDCAQIGVTIEPPFDDDYDCYDLGELPGVPIQWGGLVVDREDRGLLLVGGAANTAGGKLYAVGIARDEDCHITGYTGAPTQVKAAAEYNDGGLSYHPGDATLFLARWPVNELGQLAPGDVATSKVVDLGALGVVSSPGGVTFVPPGFAGEGQLKAVSWPGGEWYTLALAPDGGGTYDVTSAVQSTQIVGGPEAFVYVSDENPEFAVDGFLVAEWTAGNVAAYDADAQGDPVPATRRDFIVGLDGAESAFIDPDSGDFLFATFSGVERLVAIRGFKPQPQ